MEIVTIDSKKVRERGECTNTLCIRCAEAYGDRCFSAPFEDREYIRTVHRAGNCRLIVECDRFAPEKGRRLLSRAAEWSPLGKEL